METVSCVGEELGAAAADKKGRGRQEVGARTKRESDENAKSEKKEEVKVGQQSAQRNASQKDAGEPKTKKRQNSNCEPCRSFEKCIAPGFSLVAETGAESVKFPNGNGQQRKEDGASLALSFL